MSADDATRWLWRRSVRFRVTAAAAAAVLVALTLTGVAVTVTDHRSGVAALDESLDATADAIEGQIDRGELPNTLGGFGDDDAVVQVIDPDGRVVSATANVGGAGAVAAPGAGEALLTAPLPPSGDEGRILVRGLPGGGTLVLGASLDDQRERTEGLAFSFALAVPVVTVLLALVVWWLTGRTLAPVDDVCADVDAMDGARTDQRLSAPGTADEIERLVLTVNRLLDRIDTASGRQRRFVADASHELRTPLARVRTELEVDLAHPGGRDPEEAYRSALEEVTRIEALVDDLLVLAAVDGGAPDRREALDLAELVDEEVAARQPPAGVELVRGASLPPGASEAVVHGDAAQLRRVVRNLLDNAERHARSRVTVSVAALPGSSERGRDDGVRAGDGLGTTQSPSTTALTGPRVSVRIDDDGPGVTAADRSRIFERFGRADAARARTTGGTGLGLAIADDLVAAHGGSLSVTEAPTGGARFTVDVPVVGATPSPTTARPPHPDPSGVAAGA